MSSMWRRSRRQLQSTTSGAGGSQVRDSAIPQQAAAASRG